MPLLPLSHYHRFFLRVPLSHLLEGPKTSRSFWLVLKVLITQIMIHFPSAVSNVVVSVINVKIILQKVKFFVAVLPSVFTILDTMLTVNLKMLFVSSLVVNEKFSLLVLHPLNLRSGSTTTSRQSLQRRPLVKLLSILTRRNIN